MAITELYKPIKKSGFSLLEMSIVIVIIGFTLGMGILTFNQYSRFSKAELTRLRANVILKALDDYADKFGKLPCPADGSVMFNDKYFGVGIFNKGTCITANADDGNTFVGTVPTNTLNIYPSLAMDGWGNRFTYVVGFAGIEGKFDAEENLKLTNYSTDTIYPNVVAIVISHGENGGYAWKGSGISRNFDSNTDRERSNSGDHGDMFVASLPQPDFDDIVYFLTNLQIINNDFE